MCSFDAEDGWDLMQDVYLDGNKFGYNHVMCDMIGCGGHNFICENNVGRIYFWGRCYSPVARKNSGINGVFHCTSRRRSGYGRFGNDNKWPYGIELGAGKNPHVDWEFGMRGVEFSPKKRPPAKIIVDKTGRLSGSTFVKTEVPYPMLSSCKMLGCNCALPGEGEWNGCPEVPDGVLELGPDPAVSEGELKVPLSLRVALVLVHEDVAARVPQLVAEVAVALEALHVPVDVAAGGGERCEGEAQGVVAVGLDAVRELLSGALRDLLGHLRLPCCSPG